MWEEACTLLDEAERLHRRFFRLTASSQARPVWEPPVDVFEDEREIIIVTALPGVAPDRVDAAFDETGTLVIRAESRIPFGGPGCEVHRLEIPYGYFERHIQLRPGHYELGSRRFAEGCLTLTLRKLD
ncbi:MAG: molecular chaperone (small heat shock protein)-like protein [Burkholderiales bacterium]|jgi:HSP20 family molecular chaperone IbpA|nr:molecular chaperone (small heat shock protein)-like protein [Burkholderiales bacterium]